MRNDWHASNLSAPDSLEAAKYQPPVTYLIHNWDWKKATIGIFDTRTSNNNCRKGAKIPNQGPGYGSARLRFNNICYKICLPYQYTQLLRTVRIYLWPNAFVLIIVLVSSRSALPHSIADKRGSEASQCSWCGWTYTSPLGCIFRISRCCSLSDRPESRCR